MTSSLKQLYPIRVLRHSLISAEARWFDWRHNVQTRPDRSEDLRDWNYDFPYLPIRPPAARELLRSLPISNYSDYTFVDIGSGKGRMLLLASELPFRRIVGVELRQDLHEQASRNVRRFRHPNANPSLIKCEFADATGYDFPPGKLVVYLFNPFSVPVMEKVLHRLDESFERDPREILLVYVYPEFGFVLKTMRHFQMIEESAHRLVARSRVDAPHEQLATPVRSEHTS